MRPHAPLALFAGTAIGCSLMGLGVGAIVDSRHKDADQFQGWQLERIAPGKPIRLVLRTGAEVSGLYGGLDSSPEEYAARYAVGRTRHLPGLALPMIGDPVVLNEVPGGVVRGVFLGFDYGSVYVKPEDGTAASLALPTWSARMGPPSAPLGWRASSPTARSRSGLA